MREPSQRDTHCPCMSLRIAAFLHIPYPDYLIAGTMADDDMEAVSAPTAGAFAPRSSGAFGGGRRGVHDPMSSASEPADIQPIRAHICPLCIRAFGCLACRRPWIQALG